MIIAQMGDRVRSSRLTGRPPPTIAPPDAAGLFRPAWADQKQMQTSQTRDLANSRGVHIVTYGCQMNVYDSGRMLDALAPAGFTSTELPEAAELIIVNTCHIREHATEKLYSELGRLRVLQQERARAGGRLLIAVAGCVAQAAGQALRARAPYVDMVFGPQSYHLLPSLLARAQAGEAVTETEFPAEDKFDFLPASRRAQPVSAFLSIQEGCDKFCSFCVVPFTRGAETSRAAAAILAEAEGLVAGGAREITLLGQNVNAWHGAGTDGTNWGLARLVRGLAGIDGLVRIRYTTSHPRDMSDDLIAAHAEVPQLMPFLHLPVQSGSDRMLAAMNRKHTAGEYLALVERLRAARPDIALSSDFIVGHPGETEADFEATLGLIRAVGFAQAFSFKYSARPGTRAAELDGQIDEAVKVERLGRVQALLRDQQFAFNQATAGRIVPVLFTGPGRRDGQMSGRTPYLQPVHLQAPSRLVGEVGRVRITEAFVGSLTGTLMLEEVTA